MIDVTLTFTATSTDMLSGTDLATVPGPGLLQAWVASTVNTATLSATVGAVNAKRSAAVRLRSAGLPNLSDDPPDVMVAVNGGEKPAFVLGGTTGTVYLITRWTPSDEL